MQTIVNSEITQDSFRKRLEVQAEINKNVFRPSEVAKERETLYRHTPHEKKELKLLKYSYKTFKGTLKHTQKRDELANLIMKTSPKFNVTLNLA